LVLHERARRIGRQPASGLRDAGSREHVFWVAVVLSRHQRGSAAQRRAARPCWACDRARRARPAALSAAGNELLPAAGAGAAAFPADFDEDAFVALHGSWNRATRTGYKIVRIRLHEGVPTGVYEDFLTGFVLDDHAVWGRPVGVAVAHDGALLVTDDGNGTMWRVSYTGH
jgi:glucose/arabinose dehydrogenase